MSMKLQSQSLSSLLWFLEGMLQRDGDSYLTANMNWVEGNWASGLAEKALEIQVSVFIVQRRRKRGSD